MVRSWPKVRRNSWLEEIYAMSLGSTVTLETKDWSTLSVSFSNSITNRSISNVNWISSLNFFCAEFYQDSTLFEEFLENIDIALPLLVGYAYSVSNVTAYTDALKSYYLNDLTANRSLVSASKRMLQNVGFAFVMRLFFFSAADQLDDTN